MTIFSFLLVLGGICYLIYGMYQESERDLEGKYKKHTPSVKKIIWVSDLQKP